MYAAIFQRNIISILELLGHMFIGLTTWCSQKINFDSYISFTAFVDFDVEKYNVKIKKNSIS